QWRSERDWVLYTYMPQRADIVLPQHPDIALGQLRSAGLYPNVDAPVFNQHGGQVPSGFDLTMDAPSGTIWYTTDGHDPRLSGGAVNTSHAVMYSGAVSLTESTHVMARVRTGSTWSALNEATFAVGPVADNLRITEMMYHPQDTGDPNNDPNAEFIELKNIGMESTINLALVRFTEGIHFTFPSVELGPGDYVLVVKDQAVFASRYTGCTADGRYSRPIRRSAGKWRRASLPGRCYRP
ncbi:unnamed protein product, partial [marine sediment metagenome]